MIEIIYILSILLLGIVISFYDWKRGIIKNRLLLILLLIGILYYSYNFSFIVSNTPSFLWNIFWAVFIGIFMWFIDIWPSGDAKLFIVLSMLLPIGVLLTSGSPAMDFLINAFVPLFVVYLSTILIKANRKEVKEALKFAFSPYRIFLIFIVVLGFLWFVMKGFTLFGVQPNVFIFVIMLFLVMDFVNRFLTFRLEILYTILAVLRIILDFRNIFTVHFAFEIFSIIFVYLFFRFFILRLAFRVNTKGVKIDDLEEGMRPAEGIMKKQGNNIITYEKIKLFHFDYMDFLFQKKKKIIHSMSDDGLTSGDIKKIKYIKSKGKLPFDEILVHKAIPFATFLMIGFFITILLEGNFITTLKIFL